MQKPRRAAGSAMPTSCAARIEQPDESRRPVRRGSRPARAIRRSTELAAVQRRAARPRRSASTDGRSGSMSASGISRGGRALAASRSSRVERDRLRRA